MGREVAPGQFMEFVFVRSEARIRAWEMGIDPRIVDMERCCQLLDRAVETVTGCFVEVEDLPLFQANTLVPT